MLSIPFRVSETEYILIVALQDTNITRIKKYDPAEIVPAKMGGPWDKLKLREIHISYATKKDELEITQLCREGNARDAIKLLFRGYAFKPNLGDHDGMYGSVIGGPVKPEPQ